jgi:hypothetical protein
MGCDSVVGTATRYRVNGPGIKPGWGRDFAAPIQNGPGAHPASYKMGTGSFPVLSSWGVASSTEVKERIKLHIYTPYGTSWPDLGQTLPAPWTMVYIPN